MDVTNFYFFLCVYQRRTHNYLLFLQTCNRTHCGIFCFIKSLTEHTKVFDSFIYTEHFVVLCVYLHRTLCGIIYFIKSPSEHIEVFRFHYLHTTHCGRLYSFNNTTGNIWVISYSYIEHIVVRAIPYMT